MTKIIAFHSFRRGTGKSTLTANLAALLAAQGQRVGVVDANLQAPSLHLLFNLPSQHPLHSLNDYLRGRCGIVRAARDITSHLNRRAAGALYLVPAGIKADDALPPGREFDAAALGAGFGALAAELALDLLLVDAPAGLARPTLLTLAAADILYLIVRPDRQDYRGTALAVDLARNLQPLAIRLIVNQTPPPFDVEALKLTMEQAFQVRVSAVIPHTPKILALAGRGIFAIRHPRHPTTLHLRRLASELAQAGNSSTGTE